CSYRALVLFLVFFLTPPPPTPISTLSLHDALPISLAGLRVGFALGNENLIHALIRMKDSFNSYPIDRLAMAGAAAAIKDTAYFEDTTKKIVATRGWVTEQLVELGFNVLPSSTNFVFANH